MFLTNLKIQTSNRGRYNLPTPTSKHQPSDIEQVAKTSKRKNLIINTSIFGTTPAPGSAKQYLRDGPTNI